MYGLFGLLGLALPIAVIVLVVLAFRQSATNRDLLNRIGLIQNRLSLLETAGENRGAAPAEHKPATTTSAPAVTTPAPPPATVPPRVEVIVELVAEEHAVPEPPPAAATPPARRFEWERFIGLRLPVWLGAIALSIAGFFFVSYAIESGFFGPEMRVLSAAAASLAFLAGAEAVRRRVTTGNAAAIASALAAAAIATAYATVYLASITYGLVSTGFGFIATVAVSVLAVAVALAYGQVVALIGIAGAYLAPAVFGNGDADAAFLTVYVVALTVASFAVIRWKSWWRLSLVGLVGPAFWGLIWAASHGLLAESLWGDVFLIALPAIAFVASWDGWREDGPIIGFRGLTAARTPQRGALIGAVILATIGFFVFLVGSHFALGYWQGFIVFAALAVAVGFVSPPHRALQLPVLIGFAAALLDWPRAVPVEAIVVLGAAAIIFGFGALDQFRRLREPGFWAAVVAFVALYLFAIGLFKVTGWQSALDGKHYWAAGGLLLAGGFVGLLRFYGPRIAGELERSRVYAAWGGAVTTLVSLAVVLELDPLYFPAAAAVATLGLAAVHLRAPVRGLRVLAAIYAVLYGLLLLGAWSAEPYSPAYHRFVFARSFEDHALVLMVLPGIALIGAATLFQRSAGRSRLIHVFDALGMVVLALGLYFLLDPRRGFWPWSDMYVVGGPIASAEVALALAGVYLGRRFARPVAWWGGLLLTGLTSLAMLGGFMLPLLSFWPPFAVPGTVVFNIALLALALPALLLFAIGWLVRQDRQQRAVRLSGIAISVFAVLVTYTLLVVDIRQAWHLGAPTLAGDTSQSEYYAYSIATLAFGIALLVLGVAFRHRGARALSFVFVLGATIKVFLFDASELAGLWRVLSFLLMGLSFLGISWAYARFVFGIGVKKPAPEAEPPAA
ncbi:MAG: DUF2339 domain-containing protein [Devosia sp.]|nr:DUF2339 domain-containing protein [Devosia sp.]